MDIVIDFDGTVVTHEFPLVGRDVGAVPVLKDLVNNGHNLILFTMRSGEFLSAAVEWFHYSEIPLYGIQENPTQGSWTTSPKAYGQLIIDDAALGCPLVHPDGERPYVDWKRVKTKLRAIGVLGKRK